MAVLSQVLLVAFVAGFIVGHFLTGSDKVTTVTAASLVAAEEKEAAAEEAAPAKAREKAEQQEAETAERAAQKKGEEKAEEVEAEKEAESEGEEGGGEEAEKGEEGGGETALTAGKEVFTTNCGSCHTLADAGTSGEVGPNLDELMPEKSLVETQVTNGGGGMPAFGEQLSEEEIVSVAEYVSSVAGS